jgi:DNA polymerase-3 subunit beta
MKFVCEGVVLTDAAVTVSKACASKTLIPALECIKMSAYNDTLTMTAYDGELSIEKKVKAEIFEEGDILVNGKFFSDFIGKISSFTVSIESDDKGIMIKYGDNSTRMLSLPAEDFPFVGKDKGFEYTEIKEKDLKALINKTVFCCASDESRPILKGCLIETKEDMLEATALDGFRMAIYQCEKVGGGDMKIVCPARTLTEISRMIEGDDKTLKLYVAKNTLSIEVDNTVLTSRLYVGEFVNKDKVIPPAFTSVVIANRSLLIDSMERAAVLNRGDKNNLVIFDITNNGLRVTANSEMGNVDETISVTLDGKEIKIAMNGKFMLEALKALEEENVRLSFNSSVAPFTVENTTVNEGIYLILPVTANV